ncbi:MAG: LysR family transcriptional regulator [Raoultibacter sp.]
MRVESLKYFLEIAQAGSFSLAARHLYVSQQGLSKSIQALERELGTTLFKRAGKRVCLTDAGRDLVSLAEDCIESQKRLAEGMRKHASGGGSAKTVRLAAMPFVASGMFSFMKDQLEAYELRNVILVEKNFPDIVENIVQAHENSEALAMVVVPDSALDALRDNPAIVFVPLFNSSIMLMGTKKLISPKRQRFFIDEIVSLPIAYYSEPVLDTVLSDTFTGRSFQNIIMHASNIELMNEYVQTGQAVTFSDSFSAFTVGNEQSDLLFVPIEGAASFSVGFAYAAELPLDERSAAYVKRFKNCIDTVCKSYLIKHPLSTI